MVDTAWPYHPQRCRGPDRRWDRDPRRGAPAHVRRRRPPRGLNLPHDRIDELAPALLPDRDTGFIVSCASTSCQNAAIAARRLTQLGDIRVHDDTDGTQDWVETGLPTESSDVAGSA
jgi:rhodanese-related sulfurtransferase